MSVAIYYLYPLFLMLECVLLLDLLGSQDPAWSVGSEDPGPLVGSEDPTRSKRSLPSYGCLSVADLHSETSSLLE